MLAMTISVLLFWRLALPPDLLGPLAAPPGPDLSGIWAARGVEADGSGYEGACEIRSQGAVYLFRYTAGDGCTGVGVRQGDALAVTWSDATGKASGVTLYRVIGARRLEGVWTVAPIIGGAVRTDGRTRTETMIRLATGDR